ALEEALADQQVEQTVAIVVEHRHAAGREAGRADAGAGRDIDKFAAAQVAEKRIRRLIVRLAGGLSLDSVVRDKQVEVAIVVKIGEDRAVSPPQDAELLLVVQPELALDIAEELVRLG